MKKLAKIWAVCGISALAVGGVGAAIGCPLYFVGENRKEKILEENKAGYEEKIQQKRDEIFDENYPKFLKGEISKQELVDSTAKFELSFEDYLSQNAPQVKVEYDKACTMQNVGGIVLTSCSVLAGGYLITASNTMAFQLHEYEDDDKGKYKI